MQPSSKQMQLLNKKIPAECDSTKDNSMAGCTPNRPKQNRNRTETKMHYCPHTQPTKRTHLRDVSVVCPVHISGRLQSCESITWRFKENEYVVIRMAAAVFTFVASRKSKEKKKRSFWVRPTQRDRKILTHTSLLYATFDMQIHVRSTLR